MFRLSDEGLELIKVCEAFEPHLYNCPAGHCTIGYGHLVHYGPIGIGDPKRGISPAFALLLEERWVGGVTESEALALLRRDLGPREVTVRRLVTVPIDQSEYDALVDFEYNTGSLATSTLLKKLNAEDYVGAAAEFDRWVWAGSQRLAGLVIRRDKEEALFRRDLPRVLCTP